MTEARISTILNYRILGVIAIIFIKSYYEDKEDPGEIEPWEQPIGRDGRSVLGTKTG